MNYTTEEFYQKMSEITDDELIDLVENEIRGLCKTAGRSFTMNVPVTTKDSDMILSELVKRFKNLKTK